MSNPPAPAPRTLSKNEIEQRVRAAFDELDFAQLRIYARLPPERRLQMLFDLNEFARQMIVASERARDPHISESELNGRVRKRIQMANGD